MAGETRMATDVMQWSGKAGIECRGEARPDGVWSGPARQARRVIDGVDWFGKSRLRRQVKPWNGQARQGETTPVRRGQDGRSRSGEDG